MEKTMNLELSISEKDFTQMVVDMARLLGWKVYHTWNSRHSAKGFPDLCLTNGRSIIFAELKGRGGMLTIAQKEWLEALKKTGNCEVFIWWPKDWEEIEDVLRGG